MVVLVNEETASDGEAFAEGFRRLGLGEVIGTRTWGGEIWLSPNNRLVDKGIATSAQTGVYGPEGEWLYGGYRVTPLFKFRPVDPDAQDRELFDVDSMNGNCVFVPRRILDELPQPDPEVFIQCGADIEYALRARKHGFRVVVAARARALGIPNPNKTYWRQPGVGFLERWRAFTSRRGWYPPMHWNICVKYGGLLGPLWFLRTYASTAAISLWYLVYDRIRPRRT